MRQNVVRICAQDSLVALNRFLEFAALQRHQAQVDIGSTHSNLLGIAGGRIEESQMPQYCGALVSSGLTKGIDFQGRIQRSKRSPVFKLPGR